MPIIDLQRRARELGRIRIGQVQQTSNGKTRPAKLDRFRVTSASRHLLDRIAELYGGDVREWTPQGSKVQAWEVVTESTRLPVLVPPQPVTQWYELWSGGGCQRRCDGAREVLKDQPCVCGPDPTDRACKPTTRLNVVLREIEGIGVWRLETHGYYAAVELPMAAELLAQAGGYISGHLGLEERSVVRDGKTNRFMVPTIDVGITPGQLLEAGGQVAQVAAARAAAVESGERRALAAAPAGGGPTTEQPAGGKAQLTSEQRDILIGQARDCVEMGKLKQFWRDVASAFVLANNDPLVETMKARASELAQQTAAVAPAPAVDEDPNTVWALVLQTVPEQWTTEQVERDFATFAEVDVEAATAADMRRYLDALPERVTAAS